MGSLICQINRQSVSYCNGGRCVIHLLSGLYGVVVLFDKGEVLISFYLAEMMPDCHAMYVQEKRVAEM